MGALGFGPLPVPEVHEDVESSERNSYGRPYPWYCGFPGSTAMDECRPPSVKQIQDSADAWLRQKGAEGKIDPALVEAGIAQSRAVVERDCAARPADCENLDSFSKSPLCTTIFGAGFCTAVNDGIDDVSGGSNTLLYVAIAGVAVLGFFVLEGRR